jgi:hypothetical protein
MQRKCAGLLAFVVVSLLCSSSLSAAPGLPGVPICVPDTNSDGEINVFDLVAVSLRYGANVAPGSLEDTNRDQRVDVLDLVCVSTNMRPCDCSYNRYDCGDFWRIEDAQACYQHCWKILGQDVHWLDRDGDGVVCEWTD